MGFSLDGESLLTLAAIAENEQKEKVCVIFADSTEKEYTYFSFESENYETYWEKITSIEYRYSQETEPVEIEGDFPVIDWVKTSVAEQNQFIGLVVLAI